MRGMGRRVIGRTIMAEFAVVDAGLVDAGLVEADMIEADGMTDVEPAGVMTDADERHEHLTGEHRAADDRRDGEEYRHGRAPQDSAACALIAFRHIRADLGRSQGK